MKKVLVGAILLAMSFVVHSQQPPTVGVERGWNLVGNTTTAPLTVATTFADPTKAASVWKWNKTGRRWAYFTPSMTKAESDAAAKAHGYDVLSTINPGEGFWVNAKVAFTFELPAGDPMDTATVRSRLVSGWNLVSIGERQTPREFNQALGLTPPSPGVIPTDNFVSLWAWDNAKGIWYLYAPTLDANGTLTGYISDHGYLDFWTYLLGQGVGFWVNSRIDNNGKVYATYTGLYPFVVTKTGVTKVKNMTEFQVGWSPLANCKLYEVLVNGVVPVKCQVAIDGIERKFYIDPATDSIHTYTGTAIFDDAKFHMVEWGTTMPYLAHGIGGLGSYAEVADGIYYSSGDRGTLKFSDYDFTTTIVVATDNPLVAGFGVIVKYPLTP